MQPRQMLVLAEERCPGGGWDLVEGEHDELFVVSSQAKRGVAFNDEKAVAVAAEVVQALAVQLRRERATDIQLNRCSRAYVAVEAEHGDWVVADAFMRFDDRETLPFVPPR